MDEDLGLWGSLGSFLNDYSVSVSDSIQAMPLRPICQAIDALYDAWTEKKVVMFCGNGGSGASCSHIVNDFVKGCGLKAICLSDCTPLLTAIANDYSWGSVFECSADPWSEQGAVLVCVSGSGNSPNLPRTIAIANKRGVKTIGLTGFDGGKVAVYVDISIHVPTESMQQAEDVHMVVLHMLFLGLCERIKQGA